MRKRDELADPASCLNRAAEGEMTFVLLGRDPAALAAIRAWAEERVRLGKNRVNDPQILGAFECARVMEAERAPAGARPSGEPGRRPEPGPVQRRCFLCGGTGQTCNACGKGAVACCCGESGDWGLSDCEGCGGAGLVPVGTGSDRKQGA